MLTLPPYHLSEKHSLRVHPIRNHPMWGATNLTGLWATWNALGRRKNSGVVLISEFESKGLRPPFIDGANCYY